MFKQILVPTDGSELARSAIAPAVALAKAFSAGIIGVTVSAPYHVITTDVVMVSDTEEQYQRDCVRRADADLAPIRDAARAAGVPFTAVHVYDDHVYAALIQTAAREHCDVIVMASHGRRGAGALLLGSETTKVLTHSTIPVLVLR